MAQVNIRIDDALKEQGEQLFKALGLNFSSAVSAFISQSVREGGLPFALTTRNDPFYSASNMEVLRQSIKDANDGKLTPHELMEE
jgi:DNA-damage-inducible protein J